MGRPIQKKWFGDPISVGYQLKITAKLPGEAVAEGYIVEQTGTRKYKVNINGTIGDVFLTNKSIAGNLADGEAFMLATPFGGAASPIYKLTQYRVSVHDGSGGFETYSWSENAAADESEADVINDANVSYVTATATATTDGNTVDSVTITENGEGYMQAPEVTVSGGGGTGAVITATISNGVVDSLTIDNGGTGYTTAPTITIESPEDANA